MEKKVMVKRNKFKTHTVILNSIQNLFIFKRLRVKPAMTFIVFALFTLGLTAQNTGYMGKRVIVNMGADFSPAWKRPVSEKLTFNSKYLSFNYILSPNIEVITHKSGTAGAVYHYLNTRYNVPTGFVFYTDVRNLTSHGFGIFYKQYMGFANGRSPMGAYIKVQFDGFFYRYTHGYGHDAISINDKLFAMKIEFGNDFLLFDRLRLSTGLSLGSTFGGYKALGYDNEILDWGLYNDQQIYDYARSRIFGAYWLGFTVGIGFLAF